MLIKCSECGKEISDKAKVCPNCGAKTEFAKKKNKDNKLTILIIIGFILILVGLIFCFLNDEDSKRLMENRKSIDNLKKEYINTMKTYD